MKAKLFVQPRWNGINEMIVYFYAWDSAILTESIPKDILITEEDKDYGVFFERYYLPVYILESNDNFSLVSLPSGRVVRVPLEDIELELV